MSIRCDDKTYILGQNLSATGSGVQIRGGDYLLLVEGTAGGGTVGLQIQGPQGSWVTLESLAGGTLASGAPPFSASPVRLPSCTVRIGFLTGTPTGVYAYLQGMG